MIALQNLMAVLFLFLCAVAVILWAYGLMPLLRICSDQDNHQSAGPFAVALSAFRKPSHPLHKDAQKVIWSYGGFLLCTLLGLLIGHFVYHKV